MWTGHGLGVALKLVNTRCETTEVKQTESGEKNASVLVFGGGSGFGSMREFVTAVAV